MHLAQRGGFPGVRLRGVVTPQLRLVFGVVGIIEAVDKIGHLVPRTCPDCGSNLSVLEPWPKYD